MGYFEGTYTNDPGLLVHFLIFGYLKPWVLTIPPYPFLPVLLDSIKKPHKKKKYFNKIVVYFDKLELLNRFRYRPVIVLE